MRRVKGESGSEREAMTNIVLLAPFHIEESPRTRGAKGTYSQSFGEPQES